MHVFVHNSSHFKRNSINTCGLASMPPFVREGSRRTTFYVYLIGSVTGKAAKDSIYRKFSGAEAFPVPR